MIDRFKQQMEILIQFSNLNYQELRDSIDAVQKEAEELANKLLADMEVNKQLLQVYNTEIRLWYWQHRYEDKKWLEDEITDMKEYVDNIPQSSLPVYNPLRNENTSVNQWIEDAYNNVFCIGGYTAEEWANATYLTAEEFDASNITAVEFYCNGKEKLGDYRKYIYTFSPITGQYVWLGRALQEVANALNLKAISAEQYDALNRTAEEYDGKNITAKEYYEGGIENV